MHVLTPEHWVKNYGDMLFQYAIIRVNDRETARDIIQETFFAALKNVDSYRGEISEKNWLFLILKNKIVDIYKRKARELQQSLDELTDAMEQSFDENGHWKPGAFLHASGSNPENTLMASEFGSILNACVNRLQELMRVCFVLKYLEDMEADEICKELTISSSNYWVLIHRAKLKIRLCLEKKGVQIV